MAIEVLPDSEGKVLGVRARAKLTAQDYEEIWVPRLRKLIDERGSVRVLLFMGADFEGWEIGAAWDDAKFGIQFGGKCEKIAVVGGPKWAEWGSSLFGHFLKGEVKTFAGADLPAAWTWIKA